MNICMIASGYPSISEPSRNIFIQEQATEMAKQGFNVHVITLGDDDSPNIEINNGVSIHRVMNPDYKPTRLMPLIFAIKAMKKAVELNTSVKFNIVHSQFADHAGFAGAIISRILRIPFVITVHGYDVYYSKKFGYGLGTTRLQRIYVYFILKSANKIFPVSNALKQQCNVKWHINSKKLEVIPNGMCFNKLPERDEIIRLKSNLNINDKKIILSVSSLIKRKGQQNIIKVLPEVIKDVPDAFFILIGDGPCLPKLEQLTKDLELEKHVMFINRYISKDELAVFFSICDFFALPSVLESFGIVYIEALFFGKPIIGSRGQGVEDFIVDGETGFLINPYDRDELARKITILMKDERLRISMGEKGKKIVLEKYLWEHNVGTLTSAYKNIINC